MFRAPHRLSVLVCTVLVGAIATASVFALEGTWELYPAQGSTYQVSVQQPINSDGTSNFKANGKAVIPIKFSLSEGPGPAVFQSIGSDQDSTNDFSFLSFTPSEPVTFAQITHLSAVYTFTQGDCHGGSLRWSVRTGPTQSVFIYYGVPPAFGNGGTGGCTPSGGGANQTGLDLLEQTGLRFDLTQYGGPFYGSYADALALVGEMTVIRASLVLDSGWGGDQVLTLTNATVNDNTFVPETGGLTPTCDLPPATIQITKTAGSGTGAVNEPVTIQPADDNDEFRVVDCKYMYNLATSSLSGSGTYEVKLLIGATPAGGSAVFDLK